MTALPPAFPIWKQVKKMANPASMEDSKNIEDILKKYNLVIITNDTSTSISSAHLFILSYYTGWHMQICVYMFERDRIGTG